MKRLLAPGTKKLFLHNLLRLELIMHSVQRMILLLKSVSLRAYLFPLLAKASGVPAAWKAQRYVAVPALHALVPQQNCRTWCSDGAGWREWRTSDIWNPEVLAAACSTSERWTVPLSSEGLCWNLTACFPALLDHTNKREAVISPRYSLEIAFLFRFLSSWLGGCFDVGILGRSKIGDSRSLE